MDTESSITVSNDVNVNNKTSDALSSSSSSSPSPSPKPPLYKRIIDSRGFLLFLVSTAQLLDVVNVSSVTITLPDIRDDAGYQPNQLQWVVSAYSLAYSGFLLIGGRLGDLFGHRRIFLLGMFWFSIWSLVIGFARNSIFMSVSRALQGMGAGFTIPSALAILSTTYPVGPERSKAIAIFGGSGAVGSVIGVLFGGIFGATVGWEWVFYLTAILSSIVTISAYFSVPRLTHVPPDDRRIDYFGAFSYTLGIVAIIYYMSEGPSSGWAKPKTIVPFAIGLVLLIAFIIVQFKIDYPIMPMRIWKSKRFFSSTLTAICTMGSAQIMIFYSSLGLQNILDFSPLKTALAYLVHGIGLILGVAVVTKMLEKGIRTKIMVVVGWLFIIGASILWAQLDMDSTYASIPLPSLILHFIGICPVWVCCQINAVTDASDEDQGLVGAVYNVALQIGGPIGIAVATVVVNSQADEYATGYELLKAYRAAFYVMAGFSALGLIIIIFFAANQDLTPEQLVQKNEENKRKMNELELQQQQRQDQRIINNAQSMEDISTIQGSSTINDVEKNINGYGSKTEVGLEN